MTLEVQWVDHRREPQCQPNPAFPDGIDLDVSGGAERSCSTDLPYPAKRCGVYIVTCEACAVRAVITTAGRPDDPRSVRVACKAVDT